MHSNPSRALAVAIVLAGAVGVVGCGSSNKESASDAGGPLPDAVVTQDGSPTDASHADASPIDAGQSDAGHSDAGTADAGQTDSGRSDAGEADGGQPDAEQTDSGPMEPDCGSILPTGTQLVTSTAPLILQGQGITSDGYAFYEDSNAQILYVVAIDGGAAPVSLGSMTSQSGTFHLNGGKAALFLPAAASPTTSIASLSAWSAESGLRVISTNALAFDSFAYTYDVTQDGSYVLYFDMGAGGSTATLTVSSLDGGAPTALVPNIDLTNQSCYPMAQFVNDTVVAYYCVVGSVMDGGTADAGEPLTIASFASPHFKETTVAMLPPGTSFQSPLAVSPNGTMLMAPLYPGLALYPIDGGSAVTIDPTAAGGLFAPTGDVIYFNTSGELIRYFVGDAGVKDAGAPLTLVASSVANLMTISSDGTLVQVAENVSSGSPLSDVWVGSATNAGSLTAAWAQTTGIAAGFTADSKYEMVETNFPTNFGISTFDLETSPVSGGYATKLLTTAGIVAVTKDSKLVANANPNKTTGSADIRSFDLADAAASTLVTQADPNFFYVSGSNTIFYSWHCAPTATSGVWAVTAP